MAGPQKDGRVWRHRVVLNGTRTSGTFDTKAQALYWEADLRKSAGGGPKKPQGTGKTCADAFAKYEIEVSRKKDGYRWEALRLAAFARSSLGPRLIADIDASHVAQWRDERLAGDDERKGVQGSTVNREMNLLSNVFSIARKEWKWLIDSPTTDVKRPKNNPHRDRRISDTEIAMVCYALGWDLAAVGVVPTTQKHRIALAFLFALETAMRIGEICALRPADINGRVARLRAEDIGARKNGSARDVALSARALEIWAMVPAGFGLDTALVDAQFRAARDTTPIVDLVFHDTRHEAITRLARKLPNVLDLARLTGHKDLKQLMTYYNATADDIADLL